MSGTLYNPPETATSSALHEDEASAPSPPQISTQIFNQPLNNDSSMERKEVFNPPTEEAIPIIICSVQLDSSEPQAVEPVVVENENVCLVSAEDESECYEDCIQGLHRYEIMPGLWAQLSDDATVNITEVENNDGINCSDGQQFELIVRSKTVNVGDCFFVGKNISFRATVFICKMNNHGTTMPPEYKWDIVLKNAVLAMESLVVDPLLERKQIVQFLEKFGTWKQSGKGNGDESGAAAPEYQLPQRRLKQDEWQQLLRNSRDDIRNHPTGQNSACTASRSNTANPEVANCVQPALEGPAEIINIHLATMEVASPDLSRVDFKIPFAKVHAVKCKFSNTTINFPDCAGSEQCTIRTLFEYYGRALLNTMDALSGKKANVDSKTIASDITSVGGSVVGASIGAAVLGPLGFIAGSFIGSHFGRKHSGSIVGATAGAALFGPVGLIAGACCGAKSNVEQKPKKYVVVDEPKERSIPKRIGRAAREHISTNRYDYAGSTGVAAGAVAGSVLGPVGMVAGACVGALSARKIVERASSPNREKPYKFGDVTRGLVARGKELRGARANDGYKFGDFTRGMFSR